MTAGMEQHTVERPAWDCRSCDQPWPCTAARERLSAELEGLSLAMYMGAHLEEAVGELPGGPPSALFDRFMAWTK